MKQLLKILLLGLLGFVAGKLAAHPQGNLVLAGDFVLWTYVNPVNDAGHHACVMSWDRKSEPRPLLTSQYAGSDFFIYASGRTVYYVESRNSQTGDEVYFRLLKGHAGEEPVEVWPWRENKWRVGANGFYVTSDEEIVFCHYPNLLRIAGQGDPEVIYQPTESASRVRQLEDGSILLLSDSTCTLLTSKFEVLHRWTGYIEPEQTNSPLNMNRVFDMDYRNGKLLLAYWGKRSFIEIDGRGRVVELNRLTGGYVAHWVAIGKGESFLFASVANPPDPIVPMLLQVKQNETLLIWDGS